MLLIALTWPDPTVAQSAAFDKLVAREVQWRVDEGHADFGSDLDDQRVFQVYAFYADRGYTPMWVRDGGPKTKAWVLLQHLRDAGREGLEPADYEPEKIAELMETTDPSELARLEIMLTRSFIEYAQDLRAGRVQPGEVDNEIHIEAPSVDPRALIDGAEAADDLGPYIETIRPQTAQYERLREKLAEYRRAAVTGGWPLVPEGPTLKPGMDDERVPALRRYLAAVGDLAGNADEASTLYEGDLVEAVKAFQARHGIDVDGAVGPATLAEIRTPVEERIETMVLNLERRRWMKDDLGPRYVFVNLADQYVKIVENDKTVHTERLVVGKPYTRTPVFSDEIEYVVVNPDWTVPASITRNEYMPLLKKDPGAMSARNIRIFAGGREVNPYSIVWPAVQGTGGYTLRQDPGPSNALGRIKFMFPNRFNVYIHDTPSKSLFARSSRVFSHGCMRVENPFDFGGALLAAEGWTTERLKSAMGTGRKKVITLKQKVPVHVTYLTAWANRDGSVHFRNDVYGRDEKLVAALRARSGTPLLASQ